MSAHLPQPQSEDPAWTWQPRRPERAEIQARRWLGERLGMPADEVLLTRDHRQRPHLAMPSGCHDCSWSHSGAGLLVALGQNAQVGIDLEWQRPRPRALLLAQRYFSQNETRWLASLQEPAAREHLFLRLWCAKEAVLKAHGHGLSFGLDRLEFGEVGGALRLLACDPGLGPAQAWSLLELQPAPGYLGALAWRAC